MSKTKLLARYSRMLNQEILSVWLIILAFAINFAAWVIPHGSYVNPQRDPLHATRFMSELIGNSQNLYYFWHAVTSATAVLLAYGLFRVWQIAVVRIADRVDL